MLKPEPTLIRRLSAATLTLIASSASAATPTPTPTPMTEVIRARYLEGEITRLCDGAIADLHTAITDLKALPTVERTKFERSLGTFEKVLADFSDETAPLTFMGYVSTEEKIRAEGSACEEKAGLIGPELFVDKALYQVLKTARAGTTDEKRLRSETLRAFEKNGMSLSDEKLTELKKLKQDLSTLQTKFSTNLNNDKSSVSFTAEELDGASPSFLARLTKASDGKYVVTTKSTDYLGVMENVKREATRKAMLLAYLQRGGSENTKLLEEAIQIRQKIAALLGYPTWADVQIDGRMAKDSKTVIAFVNGLKEKLSIRNQADLDLLLKFKKESQPGAVVVEPFDVTYLSTQLQKRDYAIDKEVIREYFPFDTVVQGLFKVYSTLLSVKFEEVTDAAVWSKGVKLFRVVDLKSKKLQAYFYMDLIPRDGKYGHAAAFPLIAGRVLANGKYATPVASIVANFEPPTADKPSLMTHDEVETLFHEFGHIMQQVLTKAPYASLSGTAVAQDYVEAPSQMLENWVWDAKILNLISGHYKNPSQKLPPDLLKKMLAARDFNLGYSTTRQLLFGIFDMTIHMQNGPVDVTAVYDRLQSEIQGIRSLEGTHFPGTFGHMMGGYDAGYYGYLWSEVYAADMFSKFEREGLLNTATGAQYRKYILESGNMKNAETLIETFLGRKSNSKAFYKKLGIK